MTVIPLNTAMKLYDKGIFKVQECQYAYVETWKEQFYQNGVLKGYANDWELRSRGRHENELQIPAPMISELYEYLTARCYHVDLAFTQDTPHLKTNDGLTFHGVESVAAKLTELILTVPQYLQKTDEKERYNIEQQMNNTENIRAYN
ncbi:hypothetical protein [Persicobacter psychrovividus]|uniref:Uncharacterized protein n=1 Tax=Persicobacter psychrovividus TaxID=387638 RepID=A0ABM7VHM1_9BACT|nr:hypothetical protein PEPS_27460 [Persicobacter psychrovividus]